MAGAGQSYRDRERYRKRFGIESSYRQIGRGHITWTRDPQVRLFFVAVAMILPTSGYGFTRHASPNNRPTACTFGSTCFASSKSHWNIYEVMHLYHDGTPPYVVRPP